MSFRTSTSGRLLLVRHGQTSWNASGRWQGHGDPGLSALGREQARALAKRLAGSDGDPARAWCGILASDLARARETAGFLARSLGLPVETDPRLRELDVGRWMGRTRAEIAAFDGEALEAFESGSREARAGAGESREEVRARARICLAEWAPRFTGQDWIIVTHLGVIRELLPGAEPANAECLEVAASGWSSVPSSDDPSAPSSKEKGPL